MRIAVMGSPKWCGSDEMLRATLIRAAGDSEPITLVAAERPPRFAMRPCAIARDLGWQIDFREGLGSFRRLMEAAPQQLLIFLGGDEGIPRWALEHAHEFRKRAILVRFHCGRCAQDGEMPCSVHTAKAWQEWHLRERKRVLDGVALVSDSDSEAVRITHAAAETGYRKQQKTAPYADMGYLPDGRRRFPLRSRDEAWAAWDQVQRPSVAMLYSSQQLKRMMRRVVQAFRRFGAPPDLANKRTVRDLEEAVEQRRVALEEYRRTMTQGGQAADKQIRQRTGHDDHLELGIYKPKGHKHVPAGPVTVSYLRREG